MTLAERFGANLVRHRQKAGLTQERLAERAGLHRTEIGELEQGKRICRIDTQAKLCGALQVDFGSLMKGIGWIPADGSTDGHLEVKAPSEFEKELAGLEADLRKEKARESK